jgi:ribosomal-protein-alanine N-acetyltransferase
MPSTAAAPTLETSRLVLREPRLDDAVVLVDYFARNEARFGPWDPARSDDVDVYRKWSAWRQEQRAAGTGCSFLAFDRAHPEVLVGQINIYNVVQSPVWTALLGYGFDAAYEGRGYAYEALTTVLAWTFAAYNLKRIVATYDPANVRSGALLRRLGFSVEGYLRDGIYLRGRWRDGIVTGLLNDAWTSPQP